MGALWDEAGDEQKALRLREHLEWDAGGMAGWALCATTCRRWTRTPGTTPGD